MLIDIAYRQVVVGHIITTLHVNAVVLGQGRMVDKVFPIGILVVLGVIIVVRILVEELELANGCVGGLQQF